MTQSPATQVPSPKMHRCLYVGSEVGEDSEAECSGSVTKRWCCPNPCLCRVASSKIQHRQGGASSRERRVVGSHRKGGVLPERSSHTQGGQRASALPQFLFPGPEPQQLYVHMCLCVNSLREHWQIHTKTGPSVLKHLRKVHVPLRSLRAVDSIHDDPVNWTQPGLSLPQL